jgi:hypothetical protein
MDRINLGFDSAIVPVAFMLIGTLLLGTASPSIAQSQGMPGPQVYTPPPLTRPTRHYHTAPDRRGYRGYGHHGHAHHRPATGRIRR